MGNGYLESLAERVDRLLQFRNGSSVLYIDRMNTRGQLVYVNIQIPLFFEERIRTILLYLLLIPVIVMLVIKIIARIALYYKYGGWERWSEQTDILHDSPQTPSAKPPIFTETQLKNIDFHLPPLDQESFDRILEEHQRLRRARSIKSKVDGRSDILGEKDDIFFTHPDFSRLEFQSVGPARINNSVGYSSQEWADLIVRDYLTSQKEELSQLRGFNHPWTIGIRRIRTDPVGNRVLIIREC
ncbi:hypothetical protein [Chlamydia felis]|nr:hypothetical protein [Chlamydia felis]